MTDEPTYTEAEIIAALKRAFAEDNAEWPGDDSCCKEYAAQVAQERDNWQSAHSKLVDMFGRLAELYEQSKAERDRCKEALELAQTFLSNSEWEQVKTPLEPLEWTVYKKACVGCNLNTFYKQAGISICRKCYEKKKEAGRG